MIGKLFGRKKKKKLEIDPSKTLVLFVCTANLSRSPMAEAMFRKLTRDRPHIVTMSGGTKTGEGFHPTPEALTVLQMNRFDTNGLRTKPVTKEMLERANYVFTMSEVHLRAVQQLYPEGKAKFHMLTDVSSDPHERHKEVPDPHERPMYVFIEVYRLLRLLLPQALRFIEEGPSEEWTYWHSFFLENQESGMGRSPT